MENVRIKWKLPELLQREGVTVYRLQQELAKGVSRGVLYKWSNAPPKLMDLEVMARVLWGLEQITGKRFEISDVLEYERKEA